MAALRLSCHMKTTPHRRSPSTVKSGGSAGHKPSARIAAPLKCTHLSEPQGPLTSPAVSARCRISGG